MIARISVSPQSLADLAPFPPAVASALHGDLLNAIEAHGFLVVANNQEGRALREAILGIGNSPPGAQKRWEAVLTELVKLRRVRTMDPPGARGLSDVKALADLRAEWTGWSQLAVLPNVQAATLGVDANRGSLVDAVSGIELSTAASATRCGTLAALRELAQIGFLASGALREDFWQGVLRPIAANARRVVLLDQYLFGDIRKQHDRTRGSSGETPEAVRWLLGLLDATAPPGAEVLLIGGAATDYRGNLGAPNIDAHTAAGIVRDLWKPPNVGRLAKVEVVVAPWIQQRGHLPHDRHIRFDIGIGIALPAGFGRLRERAIRDPEGMGWQYVWRPTAVQRLHDAEERVRRSTEHTVATVVSRAGN